MTFTVEPMITEGTWQDLLWDDGWTAVTADGKRSAQFEHTARRDAGRRGDPDRRVRAERRPSGSHLQPHRAHQRERVRVATTPGRSR